MATKKKMDKKRSVKKLPKKLETKQILLRPNNPARGLIIQLMQSPNLHNHYRLGGAIVSALRAAGANEQCLQQIAEDPQDPTVFNHLVQCVVALQGYRSVSTLRLSVRIMNNLWKYFHIPPSGRVESVASLKPSQLLASKNFSEANLEQLREALQGIGLDLTSDD